VLARRPLAGARARTSGWPSVRAGVRAPAGAPVQWDRRGRGSLCGRSGAGGRRHSRRDRKIAALGRAAATGL